MSEWAAVAVVIAVGLLCLRFVAKAVEKVVGGQMRELREAAAARSTVPVKRLSDEAELPRYMTESAAAADLIAAENTIVSPGKRVLVRTGTAGAIPEGHVGLVCPRSGMALKHGVTVANAPGVIDSDYRGEWKVILSNLSDWPFRVEKGMRIAQILIMPVRQFWFFEVDMLPDTERGAGGFGHTGA